MVAADAQPRKRAEMGVSGWIMLSPAPIYIYIYIYIWCVVWASTTPVGRRGAVWICQPDVVVPLFLCFARQDLLPSDMCGDILPREEKGGHALERGYPPLPPPDSPTDAGTYL